MMEFVFSCLLLAAVSVTVAQQNGGAQMDAQGTEFTIMFSENAALSKQSFNLTIFVTTNLERDVNVKVKLPLIRTSRYDTELYGTVRKGEVKEFNFPQEVMCRGSRIESKGIHILADGNVIVYGINPQRFSSEGFIAIPNFLLGEKQSEYYTVGMAPEDQSSQLGVVGVASGETEVNIKFPNVPSLKVIYEDVEYGANDELSVKLKQFQTLQLQHRWRWGEPQDEGDMSGAKIECNKPCAAYSGNSRTSVEGKSRDLLVEQLPPLDTWGSKFAVPPTPGRTDRPDVLKIVCQQDGTSVSVNGKNVPCDAGESFQEKLDTSSAHYVTSNKPIMAAHVVMSQQGENATIQADPAMTLIIPEEQYAATYTIATATYSGDTPYDNYVTIVIRRDYIDSVIIDGEEVNFKYPNTRWKIVPETQGAGKEPLVTTNFKITPGTHTITTKDGEATFMLVVYGAGDRESYAYMGGMRLQVINPKCTQSLMAPNDERDNDCDAKIDEEFCDGRDNDHDGAVDEDCRIVNAVLALGDKTIDAGQSTTLEWEVFATDYARYNTLELYKQQPGAEAVMVAEGDRSMSLTELFGKTGRYSISVSSAVRRKTLDVVTVTLTIDDATLKDIGNYTLKYAHAEGEASDDNYLKVSLKEQQYVIIATSATDGSTQTVKSSSRQSQRNLYFTEDGEYSLTFQSIGGMHLDDVPYKMFYSTAGERTADFEVIGLKDNVVTGPTPGLQDVLTAYELKDAKWFADTAYNQQTLAARNMDGDNVIDALLHVAALVRPTISCEFVLNDEMVRVEQTGRVECDISDVTVDIDTVSWSFDHGVSVGSSTSGVVSGEYTGTHSRVTGDGRVVATLDGIRASQWADNTPVRTFTITFSQTNGYTLNADTSVDRSQIGWTQPEIIPDIRYEQRTIIMTVTIKGANPAPTSYVWTIPNADGSTFTLNAGANSGIYTASEVTTLSNGDLQMTLTTDSQPYDREISFRTDSKHGSQTIWTGTADFSIPKEIIGGRVNGEGSTDSGDIVLVAEIEEGSPVSNTYKWTLQIFNSATGELETVEVTPGESTADYTTTLVRTNAAGKPEFTVRIRNAYTDSRVFRFRASSVEGNEEYWSANAEFRIESNGAPATIEMSHEINNGNLQITAVVRGGRPDADSWVWTLPDGSELNAGEIKGVWTSSSGTQPNGATVFTLTRTEPLFSTETYTFTVKSSTLWTSYSSLTVSPGPSIAPTIESSDELIDGHVIVYMNVKGGSPSMTGHQWTVISTDGSRANITAGETYGAYSAKPGQNIGDGYIQYKLLITDLRVLPTTVDFTAESVSNSIVRWTATKPHTVNHRTSQPQIECRLRNERLKFGEQAEVVCTVTTQYVITEMQYVNYRCNGQSSRTISLENPKVGPFVMQRQSPGQNMAEGSLFFILNEDFCDLKNYTFTVTYGRGQQESININLHGEFSRVTGEKSYTDLTVVEGQSVRMTCRIQVGPSSSVSTRDVVWTRKSFSTSRKEMVIYEDEQLDTSFANTDYSVENTITSDNYHQSTLKINSASGTDAAQYSCSWTKDRRSRALYSLDVIETSLTVNGNVFNEDLTSFTQSVDTTLKFEHASYRSYQYLVHINGQDSTGDYTVTSSTGNRYDNFAGENVPVHITTQVDSSYKPETGDIISTYYKNKDNTDKLIAQYYFDVDPIESDRTREPKVTVKVGGTVYANGDTITVTQGTQTPITVEIETESCEDEFDILKEQVSLIHHFMKTVEERDGKCVIIYTWNDFTGSRETAGIIQVTWIQTGSSRILLTENILVVEETTTTTTTTVIISTTPRTPGPDPCKTGNNGGCHHICTAVDAYNVRCDCVNGFELRPDGTTCHLSQTTKSNVDSTTPTTTKFTECDPSNGCCPEGMILSMDGKYCKDIDECKTINPCNGETEKCMNTYGSYHCIGACECNCCDDGNQGRKKRSIDDEEEFSASEAIVIREWSPLSGAATLAWLSSLTVFTVAVLLTSVLYNRRQAAKTTA